MEDLKIDNLDLIILKEFSKLKDDKPVSTWKMTKRIIGKFHNREWMRIKIRIKRLSKFDLFKITYGKTETYELNVDKVILLIFNFPTRKNKGIAIEINNKWRIFEL